MLEHGAKSFLFVCPNRPWPATERREAGMRTVLDKQYPLTRIECKEQNHGATLGAIGQALDQGLHPDAIMGGNDRIAIAALKALARRKIGVRKQIKVMGFNNFEFRNYADPALATVTSAANRIGQAVADTLLARFDAGRFRRKQIALPVSLVLGETT